MAHLLHIDSSIQGDLSVSRALSARAASRWSAAHPGATVTYRDFGADPLPHLDTQTGRARMVPREEQTPAQAVSWELSGPADDEVLQARRSCSDCRSTTSVAEHCQAWVDHLIAPGLSFDPATGTGLLGGRENFCARRARRGLRTGHTAQGGSRGSVAPALTEPHRPGAALHHRGADARGEQPRDGRAASARGRGRRAEREIERAGRLWPPGTASAANAQGSGESPAGRRGWDVRSRGLSGAATAKTMCRRASVR